jgi:NtrC-family two-component system response regulator AlgB
MADVLVVDDDVTLARYASMVLRLEGHTVRVVHDVDEFRAAVGARVPDVTVLDVRLGADDGLDSLADLRRTTAGAAFSVVLHTAESWDVLAPRLTGLGIRAVVPKPSHPDRLRDAVAAAITPHSTLAA